MTCRAQMSSLMLALLASTAISTPSFALDPSGTTVDVVPATAASGSEGNRILEVKGPVFMGDEIETNHNGQAQIEFIDQTRFVVGPNSKVMIDEFVFDASKTAQEVGISAVKGAFRFITGASPKQAYSIRTPTMTIGVRGTAFDLAVRTGSGESMIAIHEGDTSLCDASVPPQCIDAPAGSFIVAPQGGGFDRPDGQARQQRLQVFFPLMKATAKLAPAFKVPSPISIGGGGGGGDPPDNSDGLDNRNPSPPPSPPSPPPSPPPDGRPPR